MVVADRVVVIFVELARVVVAGGFVVTGARVVVVVRVDEIVVRGTVLGFVVVWRWDVLLRLVVLALRALVLVEVVVVGSLTFHSNSVVLSSSAVEPSKEVASAVVVTSVVAGSGSGGARKIRARTNVSRIAARKIPMNIAVRLSFLFFRWSSPSFISILYNDRNSQAKRRYTRLCSLSKAVAPKICDNCNHAEPDLSAVLHSKSFCAFTICRPIAATTFKVTPLPAWR